MPPVVVDSLLVAGFVLVIVFWSWAEYVFDRAVKPFLLQDPMHPTRPSLDGSWRPAKTLARLWMGPAHGTEGLFTWDEKMAVVRRYHQTGLVCAGIIGLILLLGFRQGPLEDTTWFPWRRTGGATSGVSFASSLRIPKRPTWTVTAGSASPSRTISRARSRCRSFGSSSSLSPCGRAEYPSAYPCRFDLDILPDENG